MLKFVAKIRMVSIIIFAAVLMLSFKIGDILNNIELTWKALSISKVQAQAPGVKEGVNADKTSSTMKPIKASTVLTKTLRDPTLFSKNDINVLQKLVVRREFIDARSEELTLQEGLLGAAEKKIDKKLLELKKLIIALEKTIKKEE
jgi:hypothetical protein